MNFLPRDRVIEQLLTEFLADRAAHLSPEGYRQSANIIDLVEFYLERERPRRQQYGTTAKRDGTCCGLPGAEDRTGGLSKFLGEFLPHEMGAGTQTWRTARTEIKNLGAWLAAKG
jgi:hypothetical protein